jgi:hypothetical protein
MQKESNLKASQFCSWAKPSSSTKWAIKRARSPIPLLLSFRVKPSPWIEGETFFVIALV